MQSPKDFNHSYWEVKEYLGLHDLVVIGGGIVGLSTAISFVEKNQKARVLVLERGILPSGASTKNAGFACFGSAGELRDDLKKMDERTVFETVQMRWEGLKLLRKRVRDKNLGYESCGGFEIFDEKKAHDSCIAGLPGLNKEIKKLTGFKDCFVDAPAKAKLFANAFGVVHNRYEGQLDTALMMKNLLLIAHKKGIQVLNNIHVTALRETSSCVELESTFGVFKANKVVVATNGFARQLLKIKDVNPARAQVLITKPIRNLKIKGAFHFREGFFYFRDIDRRILFGGGRNLDLQTEATAENGLNMLIQQHLDQLLKEMILPGTPYEVERRWTGIMGVGREKKPLVKLVSKNVLAAVRMGGMGIAIGSLVGELAAQKIS